MVCTPSLCDARTQHKYSMSFPRQVIVIKAKAMLVRMQCNWESHTSGKLTAWLNTYKRHHFASFWGINSIQKIKSQKYFCKTEASKECCLVTSKGWRSQVAMSGAKHSMTKQCERVNHLTAQHSGGINYSSEHVCPVEKALLIPFNFPFLPKISDFISPVLGSVPSSPLSTFLLLSLWWI